MYLPTHFAEERPEVLQALMRAHPLATLVTLGTDGLVANSIPLLWSEGGQGHGVLRGHVARANPLWRESRPDVEALVIFQGHQAYVSPSWYPSKAEHGRVVPTWNYAVVQARGALRCVDDETWLRVLLTELTAEHEHTRAAPWSMEDAPADYIGKMLGAVVGVELEIRELKGKWKVSQNQSVSNRNGVVAGLRQEGRRDSADDVAVRIPAEGPS
ncbi:FMN-binding negative transcriptional regulator [Zoogloea sp.]|uniref:FMN-binding negative transcriptional regulator n=1 Tax=Zoogloea sp. TaxID=49181 RepID=UPI0014162F82|nr:MAG: FMN-binding negative transcriptional regulator [Zoogloea sp.]